MSVTQHIIEEQHDNHCVLTADAVDWSIVKMEGLHRIYVVDYHYGMVASLLDLSKVRWVEYEVKAKEMMGV